MTSADVLIQHGLVIDGTGAEGRRGDVAIRGDRVVALGALDTWTAPIEIDATDRIVCPGFVDMHAHSDLRLLEEPLSLPKIMQGVTTEVLGQDGLSYAPVSDESLVALRKQLAGWNGPGDGLSWDWRSVEDYLAMLDGSTAVNTAFLLPHGTIRLLVTGNASRRASRQELVAMREVVTTGLAQGAVGLSTGLTYTPAQFSQQDELVALCETVAAADGFFAPHIRSYGADVLASYEEVLQVAQQSGVRLHLTHCQLSFPGNGGRAGELHALISRYPDVRVTYDSYCYIAGSTYLAAFLPGWVWAEGPDGVLKRLADPESAERIRIELEVEGTTGFHGMPMDWSAIQIGSVGAGVTDDVVGRRISSVADERGQAPFEVAVDLLVRSRLDLNVLTFVGYEDNIREIMTWPGHMAGSDGIMVGDRPHPRAWGTFARYLGHYARDEAMFSWPQIIQKMTSLPATLLRQSDRGRLGVGTFADVVIFNPETVAARATYEDPTAFPVGIEHVLVNGRPVVSNSEPTGNRPGVALRLGEVRHDG